MAMHHMKLKSAVSKHLEEFKEGGAESVKETLKTTTDYTPEEIEEILDVLQNGGKATPSTSEKEDEEGLTEIELLKKQNADLLKKLEEKSKGNPAPPAPKIKRPEVDKKKGLKLFDLYKVEKEFQQEYNEEGDVIKSKFTGNFIKVGRPLKTNVKIPDFRAKIFNDQSVNSGQRFYSVED